MAAPEPSEPVAPRTVREGDYIAMTALFTQLLQNTENRIVATITDGASQAKTRWEAHESEHRRLHDRVERVEKVLERHLDEERDEDLIMEARLGPVRKAGGLIVREWRTMAIIGLIVLSFLERTFGFATAGG